MLFNSESNPHADVLNDDPPLKARLIHGPTDDSSYWKGYQWPATRLTVSDMQKLTELRNRTGKPITVLLHEAVSALYTLLDDPTQTAQDSK